MNRQRLHFYDAVGSSSGNIPSGSYANVYINGDSWAVWSEEEIRRMSHVMRQSVWGEIEYMHHARGLDFETGNPITAAQVVECAKARREFGHTDFTLYANPSYMAETGVVQMLKSERCYFRLWVAQWDNNPNERPVIDGVEAWAKQYVSYPQYDLSVLFGINDFDKV